MKILLAIDSSSPSQSVIQQAATLPWPLGTRFCVLSIVDMGTWEGLPALIEDAKSGAQRGVDAALATLTQSGLEASGEIQLGVPKKAIPEFARQWGADLVMVGSHGQNQMIRFLLGSVALAVVRSSPCSVEIVRTPPTSRAVPRQVLLATDGSDCSIGAAHAVAAEIWPQGSVFKLLSVQESLIVGNEMEAAHPNSLIEELIATAQDRARSAVEQAKDILQRAGLTVDDASSVLPGEPRSVILDKAKKWGADLIVLGSHGRRGLDRLLVGSVSEAVAVHASCSVRVVRARQHSKGTSHGD